MRSRFLSKACGCALKPHTAQVKPILAASRHTAVTTAKASSSTNSRFEDTYLSKLFNQNQNWCSSSASQFSNNVDKVLETQIPQATLLTCCDSRVSSASLGLVQPNRTFEIRNIGNQALNARGSIEYGTRVLKTPYLLVMGHTNCGAVMGALSDYRGLHSTVQRELLSLVKSIRFANNAIDENTQSKIDKSNDEFLKINTIAEINVDFQIFQLMNELDIKNAVKNGELNIVGLMYDIHNTYGSGFGQIHFTNINGETDLNKLKSNSLFKDLSDEETNTAVARLFDYPAEFNHYDFLNS